MEEFPNPVDSELARVSRVHPLLDLTPPRGISTLVSVSLGLGFYPKVNREMTSLDDTEAHDWRLI